MAEPLPVGDTNTPYEQPPVVTVTVGDFSTTDQSASYHDDGDPLGVYDDYKVTNRYEKDRRVYMMGLTSPGGFLGASVAFAQFASPTLLWIADWTAERSNVNPDVPDPTAVPAGWVLMDVHFDLGELQLCADGVVAKYRISGTYVYGHSKPSARTASDVAYPKPPWVDDVFTRSVPLSSLKGGLVSPPQGVSVGKVE